MLVPSNAMPVGLVPTAKVPRTAPSLARNLVTLLLPLLATQMLEPSKATAYGAVPVLNCVVRFALYQCRIATCSGFCVEVVTPIGGRDAGADSAACASLCSCGDAK